MAAIAAAALVVVAHVGCSSDRDYASVMTSLKDGTATVQWNAVDGRTGAAVTGDRDDGGTPAASRSHVGQSNTHRSQSDQSISSRSGESSRRRSRTLTADEAAALIRYLRTVTWAEPEAHVPAADLRDVFVVAPNGRSLVLTAGGHVRDGRAWGTSPEGPLKLEVLSDGGLAIGGGAGAIR